MKTRKRHWLLRRVALALAAAAVAVPSASAAFPDSYSGASGGAPVARPDDRADPRGPGTAGTPRVVTDGLGRPLDPAAVRDEGGRLRPGQEPRSAPPVVRQDGLRNPGAGTPQPPSTIVVEPGGFDWRDAGVGMAIGAAAVLALAAGLLVVGRRRDTLARV